MAKQSNDDLARALAGLASGEHTEPSDSTADDIHAPSPALPPSPPRTVKPPVPRPANPSRPPTPGAPVPRPARLTPPAPAAQSTRAASPGTPSSARPAAPGAPSSARPASPPAKSSRPAQPTPGQVPPARPQRASEPTQCAPPPKQSVAPPEPRQPAEQELTDDQIEAQHVQQAEAMTHVVEGDDSVIVPAAPMEYLAHSAPARPRIAMLQAKSLEARRTAIPVLLTAGVMFLIAGALRFVVGEESPASDLPIWMSVVLFALAAALVTAGIFNMLQVRNDLARQRARAKADQASA